MEPTKSPVLPLNRKWGLHEAAAYVQDMLIGQATWRYRIGRDFEHVLREITGVSLLWEEMTEDVWKFTFSLRRGGEWFQSFAVVNAARMTDEEGEPIEDIDLPSEIVVRVGFAVQEIQSMIAKKAFPEVVREENERREKEGVSLDD